MASRFPPTTMARGVVTSSEENFIHLLYIVEVSPPRTYYVTSRETEEKYPGISWETYAPLVAR